MEALGGGAVSYERGTPVQVRNFLLEMTWGQVDVIGKFTLSPSEREGSSQTGCLSGIPVTGVPYRHPETVLG